MVTKNEELFAKAPVLQAVIRMSLPTVLSQIIGVVYNIADTYFVGQTGDPCQVAATSISIPIFLVLNALGCLFGIGGSSFISRNLGAGDKKRAESGASFAILTCLFIAFVYGIAIFFVKAPLLTMFGANSDTFPFCSQYVFWTVCIGAVPTSMSQALSHIVRSEGYSAQAGAGMIGAALLNIALDPIFIFTLDMGVAGAGIATMLANTVDMIYFIIIIYLHKKTTVINCRPANYTVANGVAKEIISIGMPSFILTFMAIFSNIVMISLVTSYSNEAIAGMSIAKKIDTLGLALASGTTQGIIPLIGYNHARNNKKRVRSIIKTSYMLSIGIALAGMIFLFAGAVPVVKFFINDEATVAFGKYFLKVVALACPFVSVTMMSISTFQGIGEKRRPTVLSFLRKGGFDIPAMLILNAVVGLYGIAWATTIADFLSMVVAVSLFIPVWRRLFKKTNDQ